MKQVGIRVRPVIRHVVTKWESDLENGAGSSSSLGEFDHESYAEEVADALREKYAPKEYAIVQETMGEISAKVFYAYSEEEVHSFLASPKTDGESFRVFSRVKHQLPG